MCLLSSDWKCNAELYLEASESAPPHGPMVELGQRHVNIGNHDTVLWVPVGKNDLFPGRGVI